MKTIPAGPQKRITYDPHAVEANKPRVRRHEPVFVVELEVGDRWVAQRAHRVAVNGRTSTLYEAGTGFIRFVTTDEVVLDFDPTAEAGTTEVETTAKTATTPKKTRKKEMADG